MLEKNTAKYSSLLKMLEEKHLEIQTANHYYNEDGMFVWEFSAKLLKLRLGEDSAIDWEEIVSLDRGIVIPAETNFISNINFYGYTSAGDFCDSLSADLFYAYTAIADIGVGLKKDILKELTLPAEAAYESSILYIQNINMNSLENLKLFLDVFDIVLDGLPQKGCRLAIYLLNTENEFKKVIIFQKCGWKIRYVDQTAVLVYRKL